MAFYAYLNFDGTCREAMTRYQEIFGGDLLLMPMGDMPGDAPEGFPADQIAHAALTIGDALLMASDAPGEGVTYSNGMYVNYSAKDSADAKHAFDALADGGTVDQPLIETFFSTGFGLCKDRFGVPWMVVAPEPEAQG